MNNKNNLLIIFTRNPELGKVKTRLAEDVGDKAALKIYNFLLEHTVSVTKNLELDKQVYYSEKIHNNDFWDEEVYDKKLQNGKNLGEKMQHAFEEGFGEGYKKIIIIGSDLYDLSQQDLEKAFTALANKEFVVGPAKDGGYYLLGMRRLETDLFKDKAWGTSEVLHKTLDNLRGKNIELLEMRNDVDYYDDIKYNEDFQQFLEHMKI